MHNFALWLTVKNSEDHLKWLVDLTIAYPNGKPLDILTSLSGVAPPCSTVFHFRCYPISEVSRFGRFSRWKVQFSVIMFASSLNWIARRSVHVRTDELMKTTLQVPTDAEQLKQWVYDRYIEKESLLETYYKTGRFPDHRAPGEFCQPRRVQHDGFRMLILHLLYITSTLFHWKILTFLYSCVFWGTSQRKEKQDMIMMNIATTVERKLLFLLANLPVPLPSHTSSYSLSNEQRSDQAQIDSPTSLQGYMYVRIYIYM